MAKTTWDFRWWQSLYRTLFDENQDVWVMLHSGSRGLGNVIGTYFIELAKKKLNIALGMFLIKT
jgi:RNA-splicing ligase RtcB